MRVSEILKNKLARQMPARILLDSMRTVDSETCEAYGDPMHLPLYYRLGEIIKPVKVAEIGFGLGLCGSCLLKSCESVTKYIAFQDLSHSSRAGRRNVKASYRGYFRLFSDISSFAEAMSDDSWDLAMITERFSYDRQREFYDILWRGLSYGGMIVSDYMCDLDVKQAYLDLCGTRGKQPDIVDSKYGASIIEK